MATILIVDDEGGLRLTMQTALERQGYQIVTAACCQQALSAMDRDVFDLVLLDLRLPDGDGLSLLQSIRRTSPEVSALMLTAYGTVEDAVRAIKLGADDFLQKPFGPERLIASVERALEYGRVRGELRRRAQPRATERLLGKSPQIEHVRELIRHAAAARIVLITGETGTGKELVARCLQAQGQEPDAPFVMVNCATFPPALIESELFGHVRGAFSGAAEARRGLLAQADGGTLFLDEVGEVPLELQTRLLRFLETGEIRAVGADRTTKINCRIVAATNRNLRQEVAEGAFREDLYYRLDVFRIDVPPLRQRTDDIEPLLHELLAEIARDLRQPSLCLTPEVVRAACAFPWPGNVRQLRHALERAVLLSQDGMVATQHFLPSSVGLPRAEGATPPALFNSSLTLAEVERQHLLRVFEEVEGDRQEASRRLGISRSTLRRKLIEYGVASVPPESEAD